MKIYSLQNKVGTVLAISTVLSIASLQCMSKEVVRSLGSLIKNWRCTQNPLSATQTMSTMYSPRKPITSRAFFSEDYSGDEAKKTRSGKIIATLGVMGYLLSKIKNHDQKTAFAATEGKSPFWNEEDQIVGFAFDNNTLFQNAICFMGTENDAKINELKMLIEFGVDVNNIDRFGMSALAFAVQGNFIETTRMLLEAGADIDYQIQSEYDFHGMTALSIAARNNNTEMVKLLLEKEADPNIADYRGFTPLLYAIENKNIQMAKLLADVSEVNAQTNRGMTPLHFAAGTAGPIGLELIDILLAKKADINAQTEYNDIGGIRTPLSIAAEWGHRDVVQLLLERGARDNAEPSAAAIARERGYESLAQLIESYNTNSRLIEE